MNQYEELIYSLIANCNREITKEEKKILNQASAIYNTYNNLTDELGCPLEVIFKALQNGVYVYNGNHFVVFLKYYEIHNKFRLKDVNGLLYSLEDYKKDWWLRKDKTE